MRGVEKKPLPHLLAMTNLMLHGIDVPTGVEPRQHPVPPAARLRAGDRVDIILANPPFGGMEENGIEQNFPSSTAPAKPPTCSWR